MPSLLVVMIFLPALAAVSLLLLDPKATAVRARWVALLATIATFLVSWGVAAQFLELPEVPTNERGPVHPQMVLRQTWLDLSQAGSHSPGIKMEFFLGLDGISLALVLLTTILTISSVLVSWTAIKDRAAEFYACLLILETGLIGVFCAFDILLFYVFFEFTLIPLFFLVGIWGGPLRRYAAGKFFVYTLGGSLITLLGLISMVVTVVQLNPTLTTPFSIPDLANTLTKNPLPPAVQLTLFLMIAAGFMVKVPLFPFHTWLPLAHVEAPTAGSVLLAGVLLKLGTYGFLRMLLPMLPDACLKTGLPLIGTMASIGIVYGSFCALSQNDIKKLVAYSSVAHLGFCMLGLFALNVEGISGGVLQMINHGLSTGALFCIVGMFYERYHTRQLNELGGLATKLPLLAVAMVFTSFASIGLPPERIRRRISMPGWNVQSGRRTGSHLCCVGSDGCCPGCLVFAGGRSACVLRTGPCPRRGSQPRPRTRLRSECTGSGGSRASAGVVSVARPVPATALELDPTGCRSRGETLR